jgi:hypothetical protein
LHAPFSTWAEFVLLNGNRTFRADAIRPYNADQGQTNQVGNAFLPRLGVMPLNPRGHKQRAHLTRPFFTLIIALQDQVPFYNFGLAHLIALKLAYPHFKTL